MGSMQCLKSILLWALLVPFSFAQETTPAAPTPSETQKEVINAITPAVANFCTELKKKFEDYKWGHPQCEDFKWNHVRNSNLGTPLVWATFGEEGPATAENTTIIMCGVHGDEITPVKFCWDLMRELKKNHTFIDKQVIVVPLVAPDSFFKTRPTRTNGRGVDVNRNFPTKDWHAEAHKRWHRNHKKDVRKNPGKNPASEQETVFQMNLILRYKPNKVISIHAPLTLLDYDGPSLKAEAGKSAKWLLMQMSEKSSGYKISNYPVFPGSLGNWSGKEKHIPTYTLELPNTNPHETDKFWLLFKDAIMFAVENKMQPPVD